MHLHAKVLEPSSNERATAFAMEVFPAPGRPVISTPETVHEEIHASAQPIWTYNSDTRTTSNNFCHAVQHESLRAIVRTGGQQIIDTSKMVVQLHHFKSIAYRESAVSHTDGKGLRTEVRQRNRHLRILAMGWPL